jgi:hypothetical protein
VSLPRLEIRSQRGRGPRAGAARRGPRGQALVGDDNLYSRGIMSPKNSSAEKQIPHHILYQVASDHWAHSEQIRWTLMYNILTVNSILLLNETN